MSRRMTPLWLSGALAAVVFADLPQLRLEEPSFVLPKRIAAVGPDLRRIGPWIEYAPGGITQHCATELVYDAFEPDLDDHDGDGITNEPGDGYYGVDCGVGGGRWLLTTHCDPFSVDDLTVKPGAEGARAERIQWIWRWSPLLYPGTPSASCLIVIFTTEDVSLTCTAPSAAGTFPGVIYDFGDLQDGFWYADVDLCDAGLDHEMPADGRGGTIMIFNEPGCCDLFICDCTCAQPGLWGTKDPGANVPGTAPYSQTAVHWDDCCPSDGLHDPAAECFSYTLGVCPDPLGTAICFYRVDPCTGFLCGDANCDGALDGADIDPFFLALGDPSAWQRQFPLCDRVCVTDINRDGAADGADIDVFFAALLGGACP